MDKRNAIREDERTKIILSKFGNVGSQEIDHILDVMRECYDRLKPHEVALVDLYVFEQSSSMDAFIAKESKEVGVVSTSFDELFFALHDAYRGTSRIILCIEKMNKLPKLVQVGGIRHEVGHSILHGSLLYYIIPLPQVLLDIINNFKMPKEYAINLLYLTSIAVKDYEVSRLLHERGYIEDQLAYTKYFLTVSESDKTSWEIARGKPAAEIMCLVSCLKTAACAIPFLFSKTFGDEMKRLLKENLCYLPIAYSTRLLNLILEGFPSLGADTLSNIDQMVFLIAKNIIKPLLLKQRSA